MSLTSKSSRRVALSFGKLSLPRYTHEFAPKTFTQYQLLAFFVLKLFFRTYDCDFEPILRESPILRDDLGLVRVPDHTTLHRAERRLLTFAHVRRLLFASVKVLLGRCSTIHRVAADSTGFESSAVSPYFVRRRACGQNGVKNPLYATSRYTRFPKP